MGNFTCFKNNNPSVVDYAIASNNMLDNIDNFMVFPQNEYSDHSQITVIIDNGPTTCNELPDDGWHDIQPAFKWDAESLETYTDILTSTETTDLINIANSHIDNGNIDQAGRTITSIFLEAAKKSSLNKLYLGKKSGKHKKAVNKKWFDKDLKDQRMVIRRLARHKHNNPYDNENRDKHDYLMKEYKRQCRQKRYKYFQETFDNIEENLANPESFWKGLKNSGEKISSAKVPPISSHEWLNHFKNLHTETRNGIVPELPENKPNPTLNNEFQLNELLELKKRLKRKKSGGIAQITNEMILCAPESLLKSIINLFNICLRNSMVPELWCLGLICPIHKEGPRSNPDNYRGICISNSLLKLLCLLMNKRLQKYTDDNDIISKEQIGFKRNSRTSDHVYLLKTLITKHTQGKSGRKVYACFVDLKKSL